MTTGILNRFANRQNGNVLMLVLERVKANGERRALRKALLRYDDHMLRDVGLARHQVLSDEF